tara:strand:- start:1254 stop:1859 length:606 start_codon:yes stop_codon:yes gene_type:complete
MLGLTGAHRTGKTTLARAYAELADIPFIETNVGAIAQVMGIPVDRPIPFASRMLLQQALLAHFTELFKEAGGVFISDRTPLDLIAYTLADARNCTSGVMEVIVSKYVTACLNLTDRYFGGVLILQPGIPIAAEEGKAEPNTAYMAQFNAIVRGVAFDLNRCRAMLCRPSVTALDQRVEMLDTMRHSLQQDDMELAKVAGTH